MLYAVFTDKKPFKGLEQNLHCVDLCLRLDQSSVPRPQLLASMLGDLSPPPHPPIPSTLLSTLQGLRGVEAVQQGLAVEKLYHVGKKNESSHFDCLDTYC